MDFLDLNHDGIIQGRELYQTMSGLTSEMESVIIKLINDTQIDPDKMSFPDFLIFMCQRRSKVSSAHCIRDLFQVSLKNRDKLNQVVFVDLKIIFRVKVDFLKNFFEFWNFFEFLDFMLDFFVFF